MNCRSKTVFLALPFIFLTSHIFTFYTFIFTSIHTFAICVISLCLCSAPQAAVCDTGVQHEGSKVLAGGACCASVWFCILPESHGSSRRQHCSWSGTHILTLLWSEKCLKKMFLSCLYSSASDLCCCRWWMVSVLSFLFSELAAKWPPWVKAKLPVIYDLCCIQVKVGLFGKNNINVTFQTWSVLLHLRWVFRHQDSSSSEQNCPSIFPSLPQFLCLHIIHSSVHPSFACPFVHLSVHYPV